MASRFSSARHQAALETPTGYRRRYRCTFSRAGVSATLEPTGGSFTQDARRAGRWDGKLTFSGVDFVPERPGDLLTPFGTTVTVELGLELLDGSVSYVPYGRYDLASSSAQGTTVSVNLIDLSDRIERYRFETPFSTAAGLTLSDVITAVVSNRLGVLPSVTTVPIVLSAKRVFGLDTSSGPWSELLDVLAGHSVTAWYDRSGTIQPGSTSPNTSGAYALDAQGTVTCDFDSRPANVVVARGETTDGTAPVQAVAMDDDPGSPTYAGSGPGGSAYGRATEFFSSPLILTEAQALSTAESLLAANLGAGASYTLTHPFNPTYDAGDLVSASGNTYVVDSLTVNLIGDTVGKLRKVA